MGAIDDLLGDFDAHAGALPAVEAPAAAPPVEAPAAPATSAFTGVITSPQEVASAFDAAFDALAAPVPPPGASVNPPESAAVMAQHTVPEIAGAPEPEAVAAPPPAPTAKPAAVLAAEAKPKVRRTAAVVQVELDAAKAEIAELKDQLQSAEASVGAPPASGPDRLEMLKGLTESIRELGFSVTLRPL